MRYCSEGDGQSTVHDAITEKLIMPIGPQGKQLGWVADHVRNRLNHTMTKIMPPVEGGVLSQLVDRANKEFNLSNQ